MKLTVQLPAYGWQREYPTDARLPSPVAEVEAFTSIDGVTAMVSQRDGETPVVEGIYRDGEQVFQGPGPYEVEFVEGNFHSVAWGVTP